MELEFQMGRKGHLLNIEPGFQTGTEEDVTLINDSRKVEKYNIPDSYRDKSELARSIQAEKRATKKRKGKQTSSLSTIKNKKICPRETVWIFLTLLEIEGSVIADLIHKRGAGRRVICLRRGSKGVWLTLKGTVAKIVKEMVTSKVIGMEFQSKTTF
ncbi:hypothetical protein GLOIN_2v1839058, partial [Rhizophagus irregularis DAOM 181602=DAOM 197198]|eukprot:XP_025181703.1 hypothetical protein GLOIN_2v1839058 [Rhizophagus irregularis DAOM 181602=DAOM 197198]